MLDERRPLSRGDIKDIYDKKGYDEYYVNGIHWNGLSTSLGEYKYGNNKSTEKNIFYKVYKKNNSNYYYLRGYESDLENNIINHISNSNHNSPNLDNFSNDSSTNDVDFSERELHPLFTAYMHNSKEIYTKTIYHEKSTRRDKGMNQWLHPDIVGISIPIHSWDNSMKDFSERMTTSPLNIYSYELKKELNLSNIRKCYFQAVSNSSWANEGYLVAAKIDDDEEFREELKRLSSSFGIGIIQLNIDNPYKSEILFQARYKEDLDLNTINKLYKDNGDFSDFIDSINSTLQTSDKRIYKEDFDEIIDYHKKE